MVYTSDALREGPRKPCMLENIFGVKNKSGKQSINGHPAAEVEIEKIDHTLNCP
jgi:hypothetical protein